MVRPFAVIGFTVFVALALILTNVKAAIILSVVAITAFIVCCISKSARRDFVMPAFALSLISAIILGTFSFYSVSTKIEQYSGDVHTVKGQVLGREQKRDGKYYNLLKVSKIDSNKESFKISLSSYEPMGAEPYDLLEADLSLYKFSNERYNDYKKSSDILLGAGVKDNLTVSKTDEKPLGFYIFTLQEKIKNSLIGALGESESALPIALLIGDKSNLSPKVKADFANVGISHLIAVSGLHLSVWCLFLLKIFDSLKLKGKLSYIISSVFVILFMAVSGFSHSVMRAGFMILVMLLGKIISRRADSLNSLGFAVLIMSLIRPTGVLNVGLQLSVLSTLGIIVGNKVFKSPISQNVEGKSKVRNLFGKIFSFLSGIIYSTVFACVFTLPVTIFSFGRISLMSLSSNLIISFPATLCMLFAGFVVLTFYITFLLPLCSVFAIGVNALSKFILGIADAFSQIPYSYLRADNIYFYLFVAFSSLIIAVFAINKRYNKSTGYKIPIIICTCLFTAASFMSLYDEKTTTNITVCDVGNGSAVMISQNRKAVLLGCGGDDRGAKYDINNAFKDSGARNFEAIVIPRHSKAESGELPRTLRIADAKEIILCEQSEELYSIAKDENYKVLNNAQIEAFKDAKIEMNNKEDESSALINTNGKRIFVNFLPSTNEDIPKADVLIAREKMPERAEGKYKKAVVSANYKKGIFAQENYIDTVSTAEQGNIKIKIKKNGKIIMERMS